MSAKQRVIELPEVARAIELSYKSARSTCPFCEEREGSPDRRRSFSFKTATGRYHCWRCSISGSIHGKDSEMVLLPRRVIEDENTKPDHQVIEPPEGFMLLGTPRAQYDFALKRALDYLIGVRGLTMAQIEEFELGACVRGRYQGRVVVPIFDGVGQWLWFVSRVWVKKHDIPYLYPDGDRGDVLFNGNALREQTDVPWMAMEGCFDAIPHAPHGGAVLGKTNGGQMERFKRARRPVVFVPDGDEWLSGQMSSWQLRLYGLKSGSVKLPPKKDPDEFSQGVLLEAAKASLDSLNAVEL